MVFKSKCECVAKKYHLVVILFTLVKLTYHIVVMKQKNKGRYAVILMRSHINLHYLSIPIITTCLKVTPPS